MRKEAKWGRVKRQYEYWCENCHALLGSLNIKRCPRCHSKDIVKEEKEQDDE